LASLLRVYSALHGKEFRALAKAAGIKDIRIHDLRTQARRS
jgi:hypothetical protein